MAFKMKGPTFFGKSIRSSKHGPKPMNPKSPLTATPQKPYAFTTIPSEKKEVEDLTKKTDTKKTDTKKTTTKKTSSGDPYAKAKKKDPNLDKYIAERKKHKPGSDEYEAAQAKVNAAYGKTRSQKLKAAQIKKADAAAAPETPTTPESTSEVKPKGKKLDYRIAKRKIKTQKLEDKKTARGADSEGGTDITRKERNLMKKKKLESRAKLDKESGKGKGLGGWFRKQRLKRITKRGKKRGYYGDDAKTDTTAKTTAKAKTNGNGKTKTNGNGDGSGPKTPTKPSDERSDKLTTEQRRRSVLSAVDTLTA